MKFQNKSLWRSVMLWTLTSGSGQHPHFWDEAMKQQVVESGQLVWGSHWTLPSSSLLSSSSSSVACVGVTVVVRGWVVAASVVRAGVENAGIFCIMGVEPEAPLQDRVARSQVVPVGQQCLWSSQQTAFYTEMTTNLSDPVIKWVWGVWRTRNALLKML